MENAFVLRPVVNPTVFSAGSGKYACDTAPVGYAPGFLPFCGKSGRQYSNHRKAALCLPEVEDKDQRLFCRVKHGCEKHGRDRLAVIFC